MRYRIAAPSLLIACWALVSCQGDSIPLTGSPAPPPEPATPVASALSIVSGDKQSGFPATVLPASLVVKAVGSGGDAIAGAVVLFDVNGAATVSPNRAVTGADGTVSTTVTLGSAGGAVKVNARVEGSAATTSFALVARAPEPDSTLAPTAYNPDWSTASHGNGVSPNYAVVFPQDAVNTVEISLTSAQWDTTRAAMRRVHGFDFGGRPSGTGNVFASEEPPYVAASLRFNGKQWKKVGFRLKGHSTLVSAWGQGNWKLPFRLNFDKFEDTYPATKNQRFFGFDEISFSSGRGDPSLLREKVAADVFRMAGIPAARTAFYRVFIDYGDGPRYCGVYTGVEVIDDTMVEDQFGENDGNLYKPESRFLSFIAPQLEKKNNPESGFEDVQLFIRALNDPLRNVAPAMWRSTLESAFDVQHFLKYLAVNNAIVNWDSYGAIAHNHYLYHHSRRRLVWIPWDHNESLLGSPGISATPGAPSPGPVRLGLSLSMNEVSQSWPLIRFLMNDSVYAGQYHEYLRRFNAEVLSQPSLMAMLDRYGALVTPYAVGAQGEQPDATYLPSAAEYSAALPSLKQHIRDRIALVGSYVP